MTLSFLRTERRHRATTSYAWSTRLRTCTKSDARPGTFGVGGDLRLLPDPRNAHRPRVIKAGAALVRGCKGLDASLLKLPAGGISVRRRGGARLKGLSSSLVVAPHLGRSLVPLPLELLALDFLSYGAAQGRVTENRMDPDEQCDA